MVCKKKKMIEVNFSCLIKKKKDYNFPERKSQRVHRDRKCVAAFSSAEKEVNVWRLELKVGPDIALPERL